MMPSTTITKNIVINHSSSSSPASPCTQRLRQLHRKQHRLRRLDLHHLAPDMITRTDLSSYLRPPLPNIPFQPPRTNHRRPANRYNPHILREHPPPPTIAIAIAIAIGIRPKQSMDLIPPPPQHKRQALLRQQIDLALQQRRVPSRHE